jgi:hypothetical protein
MGEALRALADILQLLGPSALGWIFAGYLLYINYKLNGKFISVATDCARAMQRYADKAEALEREVSRIR